MLALQHAATPRGDQVDDIVSVGSQVLRVVGAYEALLSEAWPTSEVIHRLKMDPTSFPPQMVAALEALAPDQTGEAWVVSAPQLLPGMVFEDELLARDGTLLASKGQLASTALMARIEEFRQRVGVPEGIRVRVPAESNQVIAHS
jgi:hypothetical protein